MNNAVVCASAVIAGCAYFLPHMPEHRLWLMQAIVLFILKTGGIQMKDLDKNVSHGIESEEKHNIAKNAEQEQIRALRICRNMCPCEVRSNKNLIYLERGDPTVPDEIRKVMDFWDEQTLRNGDKGTCVMGAGIYFYVNGQDYFMPSCPGVQGSVSWEIGLERVIDQLRDIGAEKIWYDPGQMD